MHESSGCNWVVRMDFALRLWLACMLAVFASLAQAEHVDLVEYKGWTEVTAKWPLNAEEYFITVSKGHSFIEVKLPPQIEQDLDVELQYYYEYSRVKPIISMVACNVNKDVITDRAKGQWLTHEASLDRENCRLRNELSYDVLLHDENDVFAWRLMKIQGPSRSIPHDNVQPSSPEIVSTSSPNSITTLSVVPERPTTVATIRPQDPTSEPPSPPTTPAPTFTFPTSRPSIIPETVATTKPIPEPPSTPATLPPPTLTTERPSASSSNPWSFSEIFTTLKPSTESPSTIATIHVPSYTTESSAFPTPSSLTAKPLTITEDIMTERASTRSPTLQTTPQSEYKFTTLPPEPTAAFSTASPMATFPQFTSEPEVEATTKETRTVAPNVLQRPEAGPSTPDAKSRRRRSISGPRLSDQQPAICKPSSCDRSLFRFERFKTITNGLPPVTAGQLGPENKYYLSTNNNPLSIHLESENDLSTVDVCTNLKLYMDSGTQLEYSILDQTTLPSSTLLERIERKATDSSAGRWEQFRRCISDYMPKLNPAGNDPHVARLLLTPSRSSANKMLAIQADSRSLELRHITPTYPYIRNALSLEDAQRVEDYWIVDKDGVKKPELKFVEAIQPNGFKKRQLVVSNIDPKQESFDIVSRWIKLEDLETLENPITFTYRADKADWIDKITFDYQKANDENKAWNSRLVYSAPQVDGRSSETRVSIDATESPSTELVTTQGPERGEHGLISDELLLPIRVKGLTKDEFRFRLKHYVKEELRLGSLVGTDLELKLNSLAFGDLCANGSYCLNGGICEPTGPASAECTCKQGYHGSKCQIVKPCEVIYGEMTGKELCELVGGECVSELPVFRCSWPNDQYYRCKSLYQIDPKSGQPIPLPPDAEIDELARLKEAFNKQAQLVIILSVFMVALFLFSVVLIASMVSRLMRSKRRLKKTQSEVHELMRRAQPGTSTTAFGVGRNQTKIQRPAPVVSYNNQAFDVE